MPVLKAVGLGICIVVLKLLVPEVLSEAEAAAIAFLRGARVSAETASTLAASVGSVRITNDPFELPRLPETR